jgi:hypothetical protein
VKDNQRLEQELKEVKLDLRIEKREVEKKASLLTFIREREAKNKDKMAELEAKIGELEATIDTLRFLLSIDRLSVELEPHHCLMRPRLQV